MTTPDEYAAQRLAARTARYHEQVARLKAIRDEATAEHCGCGPNCKDHRAKGTT